jgi:prolyl 4-hydroxylase
MQCSLIQNFLISSIYETIQKRHCAPACFSCHQLDRSLRCAFDESAPKMWQEPGDLNRFFQHIVQTNPNVTVHSGPADIIQRINLSATTSNADNIPDGPWILTIDDFLSPDECEHLIQQGESLGYKRSKSFKKVGDEAADTESESRTSFNTWCNVASCYTHPVTQKIAQRINDLISPIPELNSEWWQLLKYESGQFYVTHTDYTERHRQLEPGVRILTVFFYLNTAKGGGTNFPNVQNLTVQPVQGRGVLWPSVFDEKPGEVDDRTVHQALRAETPKYAMNVWLRERDYRTPYAKACD